MKKVAIVLCLLALPAAARAQLVQLPPVTKEGEKAAAELVEQARTAGVLRVVEDPRTGAKRLFTADVRKLNDFARKNKGRLKPALRDALLRYPNSPGVVVLLVRLGQEAGDDEAIAFGSYLSGRLLQERLQYREARRAYEQAGRLFGKLKKTDWQALALNDLATICHTLGDFAAARKFFGQTLDLYKQLHGERHLFVANALSNLASACRAQGELEEACRLHEQALALKKQLPGDQTASIATTLNNLGDVCREQGDLPRARQLLEQSLALRKRIHGERHPEVVSSLNNLAVVHRFEGDLGRARQVFGQALAMCRQVYGERHPYVAITLNNLADVYRLQGDLTRARQLFQQAHDLFRQIYGERHPYTVASLKGVGAVCHAQGDLPAARKLIELTFEQFKTIYGERHPTVASSLNDLAVVCALQGDVGRARALLQQSLGLSKKIYGERHDKVALALANLAELDRSQGDLAKARRFYEDSLALSRELHGPRHREVARTLSKLAQLFHNQRKRIEAVRHATEAVLASRLPKVTVARLTDLRAEDLTNDPDTARRLELVGWVLQTSAKKGDTTTVRLAAHVYALAAGILDRLRAGVIETDEGKLIQGEQRAELVPARVALAATLFKQEGDAKDLHAAFTAVEQGRARVFLEALARARAGQVGGVPEAQLLKERDLLARLLGLEARLRKENDKPLFQRKPALVDQLFEELKQRQGALEQFTADLRRKFPRYAALQYPRPCTLAEARACLADNEVAVLYVLARDGGFAVVVHKKPAPGDKGEGLAVVPLPGSDVLAPLVATLIDEEVLKSTSRCRRLGARLFDLLVKPLEKQIKGKDLVLVPDGHLWTLPFEVLVESSAADDTGKYLIETRQVRYAPSLTVLHLIGLWEKARKTPSEPLWALGDPVFSADDQRAEGDLHQATRDLLEHYALRQRGGTSWARLPATGEEVRAIGGLYRAAKEDMVTGALASEKVVKGASVKGVLARKRYVHLATHGWLGSGPGRPPSLVLSLVGNDGKEELGGLNDGFLTMHEVTHLKLNADLVVLSACQTGKGQLRPAEGVIGLTQAFLYAGSRGVVCSLWKVEDEATAELMRAVYTRLKEKKSATEALALARRQMIAQERAPFYWAPFIVIGK